jgi:hypothetical protein
VVLGAGHRGTDYPALRVVKSLPLFLEHRKQSAYDSAFQGKDIALLYCFSLHPHAILGAAREGEEIQ